jgi:LmbE family N-acetylglucosaminyl deacetylase
MPKTLLALGAHYDDCSFGIPGIMLRAIQRGYRVVAVAIITDYSNFPPARGRELELVAGTIRLAAEYGVEMRFLDLGIASMAIEETQETKLALARIVAELQPDLGFMLWPHDRHADHGPTSRLSEAALRQAGTLLNDRSIRPVRRLYAYDNGPRHTVGFEPDTFVDVSDVWPQARDWLARLMSVAHHTPYDPASPNDTPHPAVHLKETLTRYRGATSGVPYAEAVKSMSAYPQEIL